MAAGTAAGSVAPTHEIAHPSGIEIRYFEEDKATRTKRHYELRRGACEDSSWEWQEAVSVTTAQKVLQKEALVGWAQRIGVSGMIQLFNMGALKPVSAAGGQTVLGTHLTDKGLIVVGEQEALDLLSKYGLNTNAVKSAGGERGQSCHDALETWATMGTFPNPAMFPITEQGYIVALESFLRESNAEAVRSEVMVGSLRYGFAGRFDVDIELPKSVQLQVYHTPAGRGDRSEWFEAGLYRIDLKTAKDVYEEHGEQLEAYEEAAIECGLPESLKRVVLHTSPESKYKFVPSWSTFEDFEATLRKWKLNEARKERKKNG